MGGRGRISGPDVPGNPLFHQYLCVEQNGIITCGGLTSVGDRLYGPGAPSNDVFDPRFCEIVGINECIDNCLLRRFGEDIPRYGLIGSGTNCQEWADNAFERCIDDCF